MKHENIPAYERAVAAIKKNREARQAAEDKDISFPSKASTNQKAVG